ncbi:hypothetical protein OQ968_02995 [Mycobacterium sp. 663a-19]|uniref:hypothetical protein n=1 Tax=Mycobacterium sp. 663a-19 TaxID=2986148 RepID=UPI002D1E69B2|nr:hypothetical protein [Mycobacterium sp. 663a-19]MEB3980227.1 hypothetical protein [Mycobacterium sp. 663a-19]
MTTTHDFDRTEFAPRGEEPTSVYAWASSPLGEPSDSLAHLPYEQELPPEPVAPEAGPRSINKAIVTAGVIGLIGAGAALGIALLGSSSHPRQVAVASGASPVAADAPTSAPPAPVVAVPDTPAPAPVVAMPAPAAVVAPAPESPPLPPGPAALPRAVPPHPVVANPPPPVWVPPHPPQQPWQWQPSPPKLPPPPPPPPPRPWLPPHHFVLGGCK